MEPKTNQPAIVPAEADAIPIVPKDRWPSFPEPGFDGGAWATTLWFNPGIFGGVTITISGASHAAVARYADMIDHLTEPSRATP